MTAMDPARYELAYNALSHPKKTFQKLKKYIVPTAVGALGGPVSAFKAAAAVRLKESVSKDLSKIGKGHPMPNAARMFMKRHPAIAKKIKKLIHSKKGSGLSKSAKKILSAVGAIGLTGALGYVGYLQNKGPSVTYFSNLSVPIK